MIQLSEHFTLEEATASSTAERARINNTPTLSIVDVMKLTATHMEVVRSLLGSPVYVNSWYRCLDLNRLLGSKDSSQHILGEAVDFVCPRYGSPLQICQSLFTQLNEVDYDQLILEYSWVHISWSSIPNAVNRRQTLSLLPSGKYVGGLIKL